MGVRSRPLSVAAAVALAASGLAAVTALPAAAATSNTVYKPLPHTFQSTNASPVVLQARGYINDVCLLNGPPAECPKGQVYRRPEVNAQAQVIRRLSGTAANPAAPDQAGTGAVQWEVRIPPPGSAPGTTSTPAPATSASAVCNIEAGNANGSDTAIDVADVAQPPPSATPCPWRLDVTLDHPGDNPGVMEVKRWRGQATRNAVDNQPRLKLLRPEKVDWVGHVPAP